MTKFKLYDIVIRKNMTYEKGCVVLEISSEINRFSRNGGGYIDRYHILDYDRRRNDGRSLKIWVDESEIEIFKKEMRNKKLEELGI